MQRRLDLAAALVHEPTVLFLDEPTTGLDPVSRKTIWEEVEKLNREGTTVFLTTQYLEEADQLANRVGIIDSGRLVAEGTPRRAEGARSATRTWSWSLAAGLRATRPGSSARFGKPLPGEGRQGPGRARARGGGRGAGGPGARRRPGITVESLELVEPTLDDVFVAKTGYHLEAEEDGREPPTEAGQ